MNNQQNSQSLSSPGKRIKNHFRLSLISVLILASLFIVLITALAIHLPWYFTAQQNVSDVSKQLNSEIITGIRREITNLFEQAEAAQQSIRDTFQQGVVELNDKEKRDHFYLSILRAYPHFSWISFGYPNGDFFGAQRYDEHSYRIVESRWNEVEKAAERRIDHYMHEGEDIHFTHTMTQRNNYYAPKRAWYRKATQQKDANAIWTDVYVFATSGKPGLNTATTLNINNEFTGVISIAIELERISLYLQTLDLVKNGAAFIINAKGEIIASQNPKEIVNISNAFARKKSLNRLETTTNPLLRVAADALQDSQASLNDLYKNTQLTYHHADSDQRFFVTFAPIGLTDWVAGTVIPESNFLKRVEENNKQLLYILLLAVIPVCILAMFLSNWLIARPLKKIIAQTEKIERMELDNVTGTPSQIKEIDNLSTALEHMNLGLCAFRKYVPAELVRTLLANGISAELGGTRRTLSILFMDLASFTRMTEELGDRMVPFLGQYFNEMSDQIITQKGTIDKYIGDAIMAFWGAPLHNDDHATDACRAALRCAQRLSELREQWQDLGQPTLHARIGINTGRVVVGNIGSNVKYDYTVLGDPVNLASRLESLNREFGTDILLGQHTYELAKYDIVARHLDTLNVKGKEESTNVYELLAIRDEVDLQQFNWIQHYERGLQLMRDRLWPEAIVSFSQAIELRGADKPSTIMISRCEQALNSLSDQEVTDTTSAKTNIIVNTSSAQQKLLPHTG